LNITAFGTGKEIDTQFGWATLSENAQLADREADGRIKLG
jgi:hypothetical protein